MAKAYFGEDFSVIADTVTFTPKDSQFGPGAGGDPIEPLFFGIGGDSLRTLPFSVGGPLVMDLPVLGQTEVLRARLFGELGMRLGFEIVSGLQLGADDPDDPDRITPGQIAAVLPYDVMVAYSDLAPDAQQGELVDLFFDASLNPGADPATGFQTRFPSFVFDINLINELDVVLGAEVGVLGSSTTFTPVDFAASTSLPLLSVDTARSLENGDADPVNVFGVDTQTLIDALGLEPAENENGEFAGVTIQLNSFFDASLPADNATSASGDQPTGREPERPEVDVGRIELLIPNINVTSKEVDGVYVADPDKRVVNGVVEDDPTGRGNKDDLAALVLDLDGITTLATGGAFPPLELEWELFNSNNGEAEDDQSAFELAIDFYYNLLDTELRAALPLAQSFELRPDVATKVSFFDVADDGGMGDPVAVEVAQVKRQLFFDPSGSFRSDVVAARLLELAAQSTQVAGDVELFVDLENNAIPGAFQGDVGAISGALGVSRDGGATFQPLDALGAAPIIESEPVFGENQNVPLDLSGLDFGYIIASQIDGPETTEVIPLDLDLDSTVFRLVEVETPAGLTETDFLTDLSTLNLVYGGEPVFVAVETEARPTVRSETGLEFDLSLLLKALEFEAGFNADVDLGFTTVGAGFDLGVGPLIDETIPLFDADLITLFDETFTIAEQRPTASFVLGGARQGETAPGAIVGTTLDDNRRTGTGSGVDPAAVAAAEQRVADANAAVEDAEQALADAVAVLDATPGATQEQLINLELRILQLEAARRLFDRGIGSPSDIQEAERAVALAEAEITAANAGRAAAEANVAAQEDALNTAAAEAAAAQAALDALVGPQPELAGTAEADVIVGLEGDDRLIGLDGDDTLFPGPGADQAIGGDGDDLVDFSDQNGAVLLAAFAGLFAAGARAGVEAVIDGGAEQVSAIASDGRRAPATAVSEVERYRLTDADDVLRLSAPVDGGLSDLTAVDLLDGDDVVVASALDQRAPTPLRIDLGDGDDRFVAATDAGGGAGGGAITVEGGDGTDTALVRGSLSLASGVGPFGVQLAGFENVTNTTDADAVIEGDAGDNVLVDAGGDGLLIGGAGVDLLLGNGGDDTMVGGLGPDTMDGGAGDADAVSYADSTTSIFIRERPDGQMLGFRGEAQGDVLIDVERIEGSAFNDLFRGGDRSMIVEGGDGDDRIVAGAGDDTARGQTGDDLLLRAEEGRVGGTNLFVGGEGFDLLGGFEGGERLVTGAVDGAVRFVNRNPRGILPFRDEAVDRTGTFSYSATVDQFLRVRMADGVAQIVEEDIASNARFTEVSVEGRFNFTEVLFNIFGFEIGETDWRNVNVNLAERFNFTRDALLEDDNNFVQLPTGEVEFIADNRDLPEDEIGSTFYSSEIRSIEALSSSERIISTDRFEDVEGVIGTDRDDQLFGAGGDEAFFGNGGDDYIEAAAGDDILGFGEGQALKLLTDPPGDTAVPLLGRGGGTNEPQNTPTILQRLRTLDPDDRVASSSPVTFVGIVDGVGDTKVDWGSFLWGGAGIDTLDLRFDRGLDFLPTDGPEKRAIVDLDAAPTNTTINTFTGERVVYGAAVFTNPGEGVDADGGFVNATLYGVENVLGTANDDIVNGDARANRVEGGGGGDAMDGRDGVDTLSYALAGEGVAFTLTAVGDGARVDGLGGDAAGDTAVNFERIEGSAFADVVTTTPTALATAPVFLPVQVTRRADAVSVDRGLFLPPVRVPSRTETTTEQVLLFDALIAPRAPLIELSLGEGDDVLTADQSAPVVADMGAGDDLVTVNGVAHQLTLGAGADRVVVQAPRDGALSNRTVAERTTTIDGGADEDMVTFEAGAFLGLRVTSGGYQVAIATPDPADIRSEATFEDETRTEFIDGFGVTQRTYEVQGRQPVDLTGEPAFASLANPQTTAALYDLVDVEFIEIGGARIRLDAADPIVDADTTLGFREDARDPFDLDAPVTEAERDGGVRFRLLELPQTAALTLADGAPVSAGDELDADAFAAVKVVAGQRFGDAIDQVVFEPVNPLEPEDAPRVLTLPGAPPLDGVSLDIAAPTSPDGDPIAVTITEAPTSGALFVMRPNADFAALGVTMMEPRVVVVGDTLSAEELAGLAYRPAADATGPVGAVAYVADTGLGLRELAQTSGTDSVPADRDGRAEQRIDITLNPVDDAPKVARLLYPLSPGGVLEASIRASDAEDDPFTVALEEGPSFGALTLDPDGAFVFRQTAPIDFGGADFVEDRFTVRATQTGGGASSPSTTQVLRIVNPASQTPIVFDETQPDLFFDDDGAPVALSGLGTNDVIIGHGGPDRLFGFGGDDLIRGLMGANRSAGGPGADIFAGLLQELDGDTITDLSDRDVIRFETVTVEPSSLLVEADRITFEVSQGSKASLVTLRGDFGDVGAQLEQAGPDTLLRLAEPSLGAPLGVRAAEAAPLDLQDADPADDAAPPRTARSREVAITVAPINTAPVNTAPAARTVEEDAPLALEGLSVTDVDGNLASTTLSVVNGALTVTLAGIATISDGANGSDTLTLSGSETDINATLARLVYQGNPDFNGAETLTLTSTDSAETPLSATDAVAITVTPVNDAPEITSSAAATALEGSEGVLYTATAADPEGDAPIFALGGPDADLFSLDAETGALRFRDGGPDVAALPEDDKDGDGSPTIAEGGGTTDFELEIIAGDGDLSDTLDLILTVEADSDGDGVADVRDNAIFFANPAQSDADDDGRGDAIDIDLDNDGAVTVLDAGAFPALFAASDPRLDFDADGAVTTLDVGRFVDLFSQPIGPAASDFE